MKKLLFVALFIACSPSVPVDVIEPGLPQQGFVQDCYPACEVLRKFSCPVGTPLPGGDSCEATCENAIGSGYLYWPSTCVSHAQSRDEIKACGINC